MASQHTFFDTHVHLDFLPGAWSVKEALGEANQAGVADFLVPGVRRERWGGVLDLAHSFPGVWAAPGLHPQAADEWGVESCACLERLVRDDKVVAVGEIGLDALIDIPQEVQERAFRGQLRVAASANLPVLIHCRRRIGRLLQILREERAGERGGIFHAFSGSKESAMEAVALGFAIGFGAPLTYPDARRAPQVLEAIDPQWIVLETDAPDLPPHPHRGEENRPAWLPLIAARAAQLRGWSLEETARMTTENARRILKTD
jgi:TatD DNase family protein